MLVLFGNIKMNPNIYNMIKSWKDFFNPKEEFDNIDIRDLTDLFEDFLDELFTNLNLSRYDLDFSIKIESPKVIKSQIIINSDDKDMMYKILKSKEMENLRSQIKQNYKLFDTSDEITKMKKKSGGLDIGPEMQILMIEELGTIFFTITPK